MSPLRETYSLETPAELNAGRDAVGRVLDWLRLQGHAPEVLKPWKLPITEAVNNAILHGCQNRTETRFSISATVGCEDTVVSVRDPGHYAPGPDAATLGDDPLAEHGRGGFLIAQGTDSFEHHNDAVGHTLHLRWKLLPANSSNISRVAETNQSIDQMAIQLGAAYETVTAYAEFAGLLATTTNFEDLLAHVRRRLSQTVDHESCVLRFLEGDRLVLSGSAAGVPPAIGRTGPGLEASVAATRNCVALACAEEIPAGDPLKSATGPVVIVAVGCPKKQRGTLALMRAKNAPAFTAGEISFAQAVGDFLGTSQSLSESWGHRAEQVRLERELQLAAKVQQQLLPQASPKLACWDIAGGCRPSLAMGGDYFDWIVRDDGSCLVLVADVMGKGMPAAIVATMIRSTWRTLAGRAVGPGNLLTDLNAQLTQDLAALEVFITAVLVHLPANAGRVTYANAGHCAMLQRVAKDHEFYHHSAGGPPLGIVPHARYEENEITLAPGSALFAFTDGCYEFDRQRGSTSGLRQLEQVLHAASGRASAALVPTVLNRIQELAAGELPDDCTLVAMQSLS